MSQMGQKAKYSLRADIVRFAPDSGLNSDIAPCPSCANTGSGLFDDLVGPSEQCRRHGEAHRLGGLEIDNQLILGRRLHRKIGGLLALEDAIDVSGGAAVLLENIIPIRDQTAASGVIASVVHSGQLIFGRKGND